MEPQTAAGKDVVNEARPYGGAWQGPIVVPTHHPEDATPAPDVTFLDCDVAEAVRIALTAPHASVPSGAGGYPQQQPARCARGPRRTHPQGARPAGRNHSEPDRSNATI